LNIKKFEAKVQKMTDEEVLTAFSVLLRDRAKIGTRLLHNEVDLVVGTCTSIISGDMMLEGEPALLSWPLQHLPLPEAFKDDYPNEIN
jgi:hypothetical protein